MQIHEIYWNQWQCEKIYENLWTSIGICENPWNPWTCMGYICFEKRRWVIFYVLNMYTPHISALQRRINCLNRENGNWCFQGNMDFDLQITYQSHSIDENLKWSHGHYGHFAPSGLRGTRDRSSVFDKIVESNFFKSLGLSLGSIFDKLMEFLRSMKIRSGLD